MSLVQVRRQRKDRMNMRWELLILHREWKKGVAKGESEVVQV